MEELSLFARGAVFGLAGGLAPGPLTALVMSQTLRHGPREGIKVAFAPVVTDGPMMVMSGLLAGALDRLGNGLAVISLVGAAFLVWLAWDTGRASPIESGPGESVSGGFGKAVTTNILNPHPYLFWFTVGGLSLAEAARIGPVALGAFTLGFLGCLVGSKVVMALALARVRRWFLGQPYVWTMRALGLAMLAFAAGFLIEGLRQLGL